MIFLATTQKKMISVVVEDIIGKHLAEFIDPDKYEKESKIIKRCLLTGESIFYEYDECGVNFMVLYCKINDNLVAMHECFHDLSQTDRTKDRLSAASDNYYKRFHKQRTG